MQLVLIGCNFCISLLDSRLCHHVLHQLTLGFVLGTHLLQFLGSCQLLWFLPLIVVGVVLGLPTHSQNVLSLTQQSVIGLLAIV